MSLFEYIKNGLPKITLGQVLFAFGMLTIISKGIEDFFGKKAVGSWVWNLVKNRITFQRRMEQNFVRMEQVLKNQDNQIAAIKKEVEVNGGGSMKDETKRISQAIIQLMNTQQITIANQMAVVDASSVAIFFNDAAGDLERVNPAWMKLLGVTNFNEVKGAGWIKLIPKEDRIEMIAQRKMNIGTEFSDSVRLQNHLTGDIAWYYCRTSFVHDQAGAVIRTIGTLEFIKDDN